VERPAKLVIFHCPTTARATPRGDLFFLLRDLAILLTDLRSLRLAGKVGAGNYARRSFS